MKEKELDLDELHQAVSQMMGGGSKQKSKPEPAVAPKASPRPPVKVAERPVASSAVADSTSGDRGESIAVRRPAATRIAPKKRGMAMDVIQATKPAVVAPPSARPNRTGSVVQPTRPVAPEPKQAELPQSPPVAEPKISAQSAEVTDDTLASLDMQKDGFARPKTVVQEPPQPHPAVASAFPDPLDVHAFNDEQGKEAPEPVVELPASQIKPKDTWDPLLDEEPELKDEPSSEQLSPQAVAPELSATPFVNAKVEKRPLGAFAAQASVAPLPVTNTAYPSPQDAPSAAASVEPLPKEAPPEPQPASIEQSNAEDEVQAEQITPEPTLETTQTTQTPLEQLRGASIPPQYHTAEKESTKDDRPIFDTKNYHTPIEPHATSRHANSSHAGIILTVILIILLIAAGIAAYFVATGGIDVQNLF